MARIHIPLALRKLCAADPRARPWLDSLPSSIETLRDRWSLDLGAPFPHASFSWVAPCNYQGTPAVLKLGLPHMEARDEIAGLKFWAGDPTAHLLASDRSLGGLLLERCLPGSSLTERAEPEQDDVIAQLLPRLWRAPPTGHPFRRLAEMVGAWCEASRAARSRWPDSALAEEGLLAFEALAAEPGPAVLLATDVHAGNVLRAEREPWIVIDPKPFVGDPAYDATQHLLNCTGRLRTEPRATVARFAALLGLDEKRVRQWTFARLAAESHGDMRERQALARSLGCP